jgi:DNA helicase II / ATP-dependent DNA helicase PcrA
MTKIAIIGTAGRDKSKPMTKQLWSWMLTDVMARVPKLSHVVSGGAAWADHLAVYLFLSGHAAKLTLHLPAPFINGRFIGPYQSSGSTANYYHGLFSDVIGTNSLTEIECCEHMPNCDGTFEPEARGYGGMFARNKRVAQADRMLAYTFGLGDAPADGGTRNTWDQCKGTKTHITLPTS